MGFLGSMVESVSDAASGAFDTVKKGAEMAVEVVTDPVGAVVDGTNAVAEATGIDMQKVAEVGETGLNAVLPMATSTADYFLKAGKEIPGVGEALNGFQGAYHMGAAGYDALTGDRDGAIAQGTQAGANMLGMIPGVSETMGGIDMVLGGLGGTAKLAGGESMADVPQSCGDLLAGLAVRETNATFGKDDSNWFADGSTPQGTRRGEIGSGLSMMLGGMAGPMGPLLGTQLAQGNASVGNPLGNAVGDIFNTPKNAPTTGAGKPSVYQKDGQAEHELWAGLFD